MNKIKWYAIETNNNAEFTVYQHAIGELVNDEFEVYLPIEEQKKKKLALFKNYIFVKHDEDSYHRMKHKPGVKSYVSLGGNLTAIPEEQIDLVKKVEAHFKDVKMGKMSLIKGDLVRVLSGVLSGTRGVVIEGQTGKKVAIAIGSPEQQISVKLPASDVMTLKGAKKGHHKYLLS